MTNITNKNLVSGNDSAIHTIRRIYGKIQCKGKNISAVIDCIEAIISCHLSTLGFIKLRQPDFSNYAAGAATLALDTAKIALSTQRGKWFFSMFCLRRGDFRAQRGIINRYSRSSIHRQLQILIRKDDLGGDEIWSTILLMFDVLGLRRSRITKHPDNWSSPIIGAFGKGYEVRYMGVEVMQVTEFKSYADQNIAPIYELVWGLERLCYVMLIESGCKIDSVFGYKHYDRMCEKESLSDAKKTMIHMSRMYMFKGSLNWMGILKLIDLFNIMVSKSISPMIRVRYLKIIRKKTAEKASRISHNINSRLKLKECGHKWSSVPYSPEDLSVAKRIFKRSFVEEDSFEKHWCNARLLEDCRMFQKQIKDLMGHNWVDDMINLYCKMGEMSAKAIMNAYTYRLIRLGQNPKPEKIIIKYIEFLVTCIHRAGDLEIPITAASDETAIRKTSKELLSILRSKRCNVPIPIEILRQLTNEPWVIEVPWYMIGNHEFYTSLTRPTINRIKKLVRSKAGKQMKTQKGYYSNVEFVSTYMGPTSRKATIQKMSKEANLLLDKTMIEGMNDLIWLLRVGSLLARLTGQCWKS